MTRLPRWLRYERARELAAADRLAIAKLRAQGYEFNVTSDGYSVAFLGALIEKRETKAGPNNPRSTESAYAQEDVNLSAARAAAENHQKLNSRGKT